MAGYRLALKGRFHPALRIQAPSIPAGDIFPACSVGPTALKVSPVWRGASWAFGRKVEDNPQDEIPDWHRSLIDGRRRDDANQPWWQIGDSSGRYGDIKGYWEASRWDWVLTFAQEAAAHPNASALGRLNDWLRDWLANNPAYSGANWVCGQEASLRVLHLALAARILGCLAPMGEALEAVLVMHLRRIAPTIAYATGQDNNHATSEGAALLVGGLWLTQSGNRPDSREDGKKWAEQGRLLLDERVRRLVFDDGGFAQYSVNYHRLMLDAVSVAELFRATFGGRPFQPLTRARLAKAADWLAGQVVDDRGRTPNLGNNDGAWLLPLGRCRYSDYRPSAALAAELFGKRSLFAGVESVEDTLAWLDVGTAGAVRQSAPAEDIRKTVLMRQSCLAQVRSGGTFAQMRLPGNRFRPGQSDLLHLEIWREGVPIAIDAGTFSYALPEGLEMASAKAHNTVCFGGRDQMPRLGRFLFANWPAAQAVEAQGETIAGAYRDYEGAVQHRKVTVGERDLIVADTLASTGVEAELGWTLPGEGWACEGGEIIGERVRISAVADDGRPLPFTLSPCLVSPTYAELVPATRASAAIAGHGRFTTRFIWR